MSMVPLAFKPQEAARLLSIHRSTLNRMIIAGEIVPIKVHGNRRIPRSEIERIIGAPIPEPGQVTEGPTDNLVWLR